MLALVGGVSFWGISKVEAKGGEGGPHYRTVYYLERAESRGIVFDMKMLNFNVPGGNDVTGMTVSMTHNPKALGIDRVDLGSAMEEIAGGAGPEFVAIDLSQGGVTVDLIFDRRGQVVLEPQLAPYSILELTYRARVKGQNQLVPIEFRSHQGARNQVFMKGGEFERPLTLDNEVLLP